MLRKSLLRPLFSKLDCNSMRLMTTTTNTLAANDLVLAHEINDKGVLTINRPKALNATNLAMLEKLLVNIQKWNNQKSLIIVKNVGKGFSAGGDLRSIVESDTNYGRIVFRTEYIMNHTIANLNTPYVALINGITMGGGVGISLYGKYCIATENTLVAMPESAAGNFYINRKINIERIIFFTLNNFQILLKDFSRIVELHTFFHGFKIA